MTTREACPGCNTRPAYCGVTPGDGWHCLETGCRNFDSKWHDQALAAMTAVDAQDSASSDEPLVIEDTKPMYRGGVWWGPLVPLLLYDELTREAELLGMYVTDGRKTLVTIEAAARKRVAETVTRSGTSDEIARAARLA